MSDEKQISKGTAKKIIIAVSFIIIFTVLVFWFFYSKKAEAPVVSKNNVENVSVAPKESSKAADAIENKVVDWLEYKNYQYNYSIKYPQNWTIEGKKLDKVKIVPQDFPDMHFEITVIPVSENINIDELIKKTIADELSGGRRMNKEETKVAGINGYAVSSCGKFECVTQKWAVVSDGLFYFLNSKNGLRLEFEQIFSTFKLIK